MIDLSEDTFIPEFVSRCWRNGVMLEFGCVLDKKMQAGRPGVAGEFRPELRQGAGDHANVFLRACDSGLLDPPRVTDTLEVMDSETNSIRTYDVRGVDGPTGGVYDLLCSERGSRLVDSRRKAGNAVTGVRN